jgi:hypothetical protein
MQVNLGMDINKPELELEIHIDTWQGANIVH